MDLDLYLKEKAQQDEIFPTQAFYVLISFKEERVNMYFWYYTFIVFLLSDVEISFEYSLGAEEGWTKITQAETTLPSVNAMCT